MGQRIAGGVLVALLSGGVLPGVRAEGQVESQSVTGQLDENSQTLDDGSTIGPRLSWRVIGDLWSSLV